MKRIFILVLSIILSTVLLSACASLEKKEINIIKFESGTYFNKNWDDAVGTYKNAVVPNQDVALEIAQAIFKGMDKSDEAQALVPQSVFYDEKDGIWIVSFGKASNSITIGGDCNIAIQKEDGKILRIWFGE